MKRYCEVTIINIVWLYGIYWYMSYEYRGQKQIPVKMGISLVKVKILIHWKGDNHTVKTYVYNRKWNPWLFYFFYIF